MTFDLNWPLTYLMDLWVRQNLGFPMNSLPANFEQNSTIFCKVIISSHTKWLGHVQLLLFSMGKPTGSWSYVVTSFFHGETIQNHESVTAVTTFSLKENESLELLPRDMSIHISLNKMNLKWSQTVTKIPCYTNSKFSLYRYLRVPP